MASYPKDRPSGSARGAESTDNGRLRRGGYLEIAERDHILRVVREANGVIGGPAGAAARLGMKPTTLQSRMKKLRISRHL
jgi:transcriptional regulator with GAF, ATPase, and Fis domain